jgi:cytochrome c biogenesis protein CcmG/thiol:disulfide interchange protein DsbE
MIVSLMLVFGFNMARHSPSPESAAAARLQGKPAQDFTLQSLDGKQVRLSDFRGKAVLLNFWATWCEPCKIEMPWFVELQKQYGSQGLQIVGVAMDDADPQDIAKFAREMSIDYPILVGGESARDKVALEYGGVQFLPETFFIARDGKVLDKIFGLKSKGEIEDAIKKTLGPVAQAQEVERRPAAE